MALILTLLICGVLLVIAEMVIPGGVVGGIGILLIVTGIILGFGRSQNLGFGLLCGVIVFGLIAFWAWVRFFPSSPVGKRMFLGQNAKTWHGYEVKNQELLGKRGVAHTLLRPSGSAMIENQRIDVVTEGGIIEKGEEIAVIEVEGNRIVVCRASDLDSPQPSADEEAESS